MSREIYTEADHYAARTQAAADEANQYMRNARRAAVAAVRAARSGDLSQAVTKAAAAHKWADQADTSKNEAETAARTGLELAQTAALTGQCSHSVADAATVDTLKAAAKAGAAATEAQLQAHAASAAVGALNS